MTGLLRLRVTGREDVAAGVVALTLQDPSGDPLPVWTPGAHLDLHLPGGLVRQYSLCSDPHDRTRYRVAVLLVQDGRGGSAAVHKQLQDGTEVTASGPRNQFELAPDGPVLLVAGGIGVTPLLPMAWALAASGRDWQMLYGGRSRASMAFVDELSAAAGDRLHVVPQDTDGMPDLPGFLRQNPGATVHACGPAGLLDAARTAHPGPVRVERFAPEADIATGEAFEVELRRTGTLVTVPEDLSVLDAVRRAGADVPSSCEMGICGTCETKVIAGTPDHRDDLLTPDERAAGTSMMICVSRSRGPRLVLDL